MQLLWCSLLVCRFLLIRAIHRETSPYLAPLAHQDLMDAHFYDGRYQASVFIVTNLMAGIQGKSDTDVFNLFTNFQSSFTMCYVRR